MKACYVFYQATSKVTIKFKSFAGHNIINILGYLLLVTCHISEVMGSGTVNH